jgi:hypothetical protein
MNSCPETRSLVAQISALGVASFEEAGASHCRHLDERSRADLVCDGVGGAQDLMWSWIVKRCGNLPVGTCSYGVQIAYGTGWGKAAVTTRRRAQMRCSGQEVAR